MLHFQNLDRHSLTFHVNTITCIPRMQSDVMEMLYKKFAFIRETIIVKDTMMSELYLLCDSVTG
jgi:hypothetical protein